MIITVQPELYGRVGVGFCRVSQKSLISLGPYTAA